MSKAAADPTYELLGKLVRALDAKKAENLRVLDVGGLSTITDYLVIGTGTSDPHLRALRIEAEKILDEARAPIAGMDLGTYGSGWLVLDAYQIMAHFFTAEKRDDFKLEKLWQDARELRVSDFIKPPPKKKVAARKKTVVKAKKPAAKKTVKKAVKKTAGQAAVKKAAVKKKAPAKKKVPATKKKTATVKKKR